MMAADEPDRFVVVDAGVGVADVFDQTRRAIGRLPGLAALASVPVRAGLDEPQPPALRMNR
jgi:hypothetical protein